MLNVLFHLCVTKKIMDRNNDRSAFWLITTLFFSVALASSLNRSETPDRLAELSCAEIRHLHTAKLLGPIDVVPTEPVNGTDLRICSSERSCCTPVVEKRFQEIVKKEFLSIVQSSGSYLKNVLTQNTEILEERFLDLIKISENKTILIFDELYKQMAIQTQELITRMFDGLSEFLRGRNGSEISVDDVVAGFFDALFPHVYHRIINPKLKEFNVDYKDCLEKTRGEIKPFGEIPTTIAVMLTKSFETTRTFTNALHLGIEVLETLNHLEVAPECEVALHKLLYCSKCQGLVGAKACNGYCSNVIRGCLANVAEMDQPWHDYLKALEKLSAGMESGSVMNNVASELPSKISEAVMHAMDNGPKIFKEVKRVCGLPKGGGHEYGVMTDANRTTEAPILNPHTTDPGLYTTIREFMKSLGQSKNFFAALADVLCNEDSLAVQSENNCWNGQTLGEYTKTIAGVGLSAQKYNPELKLQHFKDTKCATLIEKLKQMRKTLHSRAVLLPERDAFLVNDGSGSGWGNYNGNDDNIDDEDYGNGSGSGDYHEEDDVQSRSGVVEGDQDLGFPDESENKPSIVQLPSKAVIADHPTYWLLITSVVIHLFYLKTSGWTSG